MGDKIYLAQAVPQKKKSSPPSFAGKRKLAETNKSKIPNKIKHSLRDKLKEQNDRKERNDKESSLFSIGLGVNLGFILFPFSGLKAKDLYVPPHPDDIKEKDFSPKPVEIKYNYPVFSPAPYLDLKLRLSDKLSLKNRTTFYPAPIIAERGRNYSGNNVVGEGHYSVHPFNRTQYENKKTNAYTYVGVGRGSFSNDLSLTLWPMDSRSSLGGINVGVSLIGIQHIYGWDRNRKTEIESSRYHFYPGINFGAKLALPFISKKRYFAVIGDFSLSVGFSDDVPVVMFNFSTLPVVHGGEVHIYRSDFKPEQKLPPLTESERKILSYINILRDTFKEDGRAKEALVKMGKPIIPELIAFLDDQEINHKIAEILGKIGDPSAIPALIRMSERKSEWTRRCAMDALAKFNGPDGHTRLLALEKLIKSGKKSILPALLIALKDEESEIRSKVIVALAKIDDFSIIVPLLKFMERGGDNSLSVKAESVLCKMRIKTQSELFTLLQLYKKAKLSRIRNAISEMVLRIKDPFALSLFLEVLNDKDLGGLAVRGLGNIGGQASEAAFIRILKSKETYLKRAVIDKLREIKIKTPALLSSVIEAYKNEDESSQKDSIKVLISEVKKPFAVPIFVRALSGKNNDLRVIAVEALGNIGDRSAIPALLRLSKKNETLRNQIVEAFGKIKDPSSVPYLLRLMRKGSLERRVWLAGILGKIGDGRAIRSIIRLLRKRTNIDDTVREEVKDALRMLVKKNKNRWVKKWVEKTLKNYSLQEPTVLSVKRTGIEGSNHRSYKYISTFRFKRVPKSAVTAMPILHGYCQKMGYVKNKRLRVSIYLDNRNNLTSGYILFFDKRGNIVGETESFEVQNPD
ncbi:MAG: HEAT repeat domain-containing protein [Candidatus Saganbacteria bacterium]|nr:HEAT repeat domain-containing protein [Candidatus Saganbacteria bacterium]